MIERLQDIQSFLRTLLAPLIHPGDRALDLTAGRGRDTLFLAEAVGAKGQVDAFDVQAAAIASTQRVLEEAGVAGRVFLHQADHAQVKEFVSEPVQVAMFNLGYLPGSDRCVTTEARSTLPAIQGVLDLLDNNGVLALTVYRGHPGGKEEAQAVEKYLRSLSDKRFSVLEGQYINQGDQAPYWILVQKKRGKCG